MIHLIVMFVVVMLAFQIIGGIIEMIGSMAAEGGAGLGCALVIVACIVIGLMVLAS